MKNDVRFLTWNWNMTVSPMAAVMMLGVKTFPAAPPTVTTWTVPLPLAAPASGMDDAVAAAATAVDWVVGTADSTTVVAADP